MRKRLAAPVRLLSGAGGEEWRTIGVMAKMGKIFFRTARLRTDMRVLTALKLSCIPAGVRFALSDAKCANLKSTAYVFPPQLLTQAIAIKINTPSEEGNAKIIRMVGDRCVCLKSFI